METKSKIRKGADLRLTRSEARAIRATVLEIVALMRRAHGLTTQQQVERVRRRVTRLLPANDPHHGN